MTCFVNKGVEGNLRTPPTPYTFFVRTHDVNRTGNKKEVRNPIFNLCAKSEADMTSWIRAFEQGMKAIDWFEQLEEMPKNKLCASSSIPLTYNDWFCSVMNAVDFCFLYLLEGAKHPCQWMLAWFAGVQLVSVLVCLCFHIVKLSQISNFCINSCIY